MKGKDIEELIGKLTLKQIFVRIGDKILINEI